MVPTGRTWVNEGLCLSSVSGFEVGGEVLMERIDFAWPCYREFPVLILSSGNESDCEREAFMLVNRSNK